MIYKRGLWSALMAFAMESGVEIDYGERKWPEPKATHQEPTAADLERIAKAEAKRRRKMAKRADRKEG